jgi:outer membrane protein assembly factor BamA
VLRWLLALAVTCAAVTGARADDQPRPIVGFRVKGKTKLAEQTLSYLSHVRIGDEVTTADIPRLETALISSELFETALVTLEDAPGGVIVVATLDDKLSWIAAPTVYLLPNNTAFGVGFVENDFRGRDQKILLYGQLGTQTSILFATFLDPSYHGSKLSYRTDLYLERHHIDEYANPPGDPTSKEIDRSTTETFLDAGVLVGWNFKWWLVGDARLRGAYVYFRDPVNPSAGNAPVPVPEKDGWDVTAQLRLTLDHRFHRFGVTRGPFVQLLVEPSIPGLDSYGQVYGNFRAYYSWEIFCEHQLELRTIQSLGYHLPAHEELSLGGVGSLRGYPNEQFRGDFISFYRAEYSFPLFKWWFFAFRGLGFYDGGYAGFYHRRPSDRDYLTNQLGPGVWRNDVGLGFRVYVKAVVLPLLGFDVAYGIEAKSPEIVFELGLTDF